MHLTYSPRHRNNAFSVLLSVLILAVLFCSQQVLAMDQNTVFLPLKINAQNPDTIRPLVDGALENALREKGFNLVSRNQAQQMLNYSGSWPPPARTLQAVAAKTGFDYVAIGSLTQLGNQISIDFSVYDALVPRSPFSAFREASTMDGLQQITGETVNDILSYSNRNFTIASIAPAGNVRIDSGAILRKIETQPGDFYDPDKLRQDLKAVFSMGYFDNVEIDSSETDRGKNIVFLVTEKPLIGNVIITGTDELKEEEVIDAANIKTNTILNPSRINDAVQRIKDLYKSKGYYNTEVNAKLSYPTEESAEVRLVVDEGNKITVKEITFQGNSLFDDDELEDVIQTSTYAWWLSWLTEDGLLEMEVLKQDAARIKAFYHNHGFIEAKVGMPTVEQKEDDLFLTFSIEEGTRYRVGTVDIQGDLIKDKHELMSMLKIRKEAYLNRQVLREDSTRLTDLYAEHGYAFSEISPRINKADTGKRVDITLYIDQGSLVYFNRVEIRGNTRTRDNVIRRDLAVKEGGIFDSKAIRSSTQKLQRLEFFEEVTVTPQPTMHEDQMDVIVDVKEKSTGQFSIGAGYSSSEQLMFMGEVSENNFLGTGNRVAFTGTISSKTARYNLNFTNPRLFDSQVSAGFDLYSWEREYDDYTKESTGGALRFGHPLFERWRIYYSYGLSDTNLTDVSDDASQAIIQSQDIHITSAVTGRLVRDTRDRVFAPNRGSRNIINIEYAGGPLGGDAQFTKIDGATSWYFPMFMDTVFHIKGSAGQAFENEDGKLPVYEHFYLGGMNSIRGFESSSISPVDPETGEKIGGDKMWYGNVEIIFPLLPDMGVRGAVFTDFGNVYGVDEDWNFDEIKKSAGVEVLWMSPLGPLRLAWGFNLDQQEGEDASNWDFSMGGTF